VQVCISWLRHQSISSVARKRNKAHRRKHTSMERTSFGSMFYLLEQRLMDECVSIILGQYCISHWTCRILSAIRMCMDTNACARRRRILSDCVYNPIRNKSIAVIRSTLFDPEFCGLHTRMFPEGLHTKHHTKTRQMNRKQKQTSFEDELGKVDSSSVIILVLYCLQSYGTRYACKVADVYSIVR
jgi:hypothetical protein